MTKQKEFFKKIHPDQFSDSKIMKVGKLDRDFFDYYLDSLTSRGQEKEFETFCRKIAEREICPNLLPQTGPTGGGDSKVDSETYPVADTISETWYYGIGNVASNERWAFAVSAKKDWKPKVKSDVSKIVGTNLELDRQYKKIFFMSNQFISDKKRSETEDNLRKEYGIDIRILDRNWILEKVFTNKNQEIAVKCFGLSDSFLDEEQIGSMDYKRKMELNEIEEKLSNPINYKGTVLLQMANRAIVLGRELELPLEKLIGKLDRAYDLAIKYGTKVEVADCIYDYAWTIFWWYDDINLYYQKFIEYEKVVVKEWNVHQLQNLTTLWLNLYSATIETPDKYNLYEHTETLKKEHQKYISDLNKPNTALEARVSYQNVRLLLGDDINQVIEEFIDIVNKCDSNLDIDLVAINKIVMGIPTFKKAKQYDELFELLIDKMSKRTQELSAAQLLMHRGFELHESMPYEAISYLSRALIKLFKEESKYELISSLVCMASCYENVGLLWAARNFYMYIYCLCLNQYMKYGEIHPGFIISANRLKYLELRFGRIIYATEFHYLENILKHLYYRMPNSDDKEELFDYILGIQVFRTEYDTLKRLRSFPHYLLEKGLYLSNIAMLYELGHFDINMLEQLNGSKEAYEDFVYKWYNQPAKEHLTGKPWYGFSDKVKLTSKILGCRMNVIANNNSICMEMGATILASLESFLSTGIKYELIPMADIITFEVVYIETQSFIISLEQIEDKKNYIRIKCSNYRKDEFLKAQETVNDLLVEILAKVISILFPYPHSMASLENIIINENALERAHIFSNSIFYVLETLGESMFEYDAVITKDDKEFDLLRDRKVYIKQDVEPINIEPEDNLDIVYKDLPQELNFNNVNQGDIQVNSIINIHLWEKAKWRGVFFLTAPGHVYLPVFSPLFMDFNSGIRIFREWIEDFGKIDHEDNICIGIIKGIDKNNPYWYRVIIGSNSTKNLKKSKESIQLVNHINRLHTMEAQTSENLERFIIELKNSSQFIFVPSTMDLSKGQPVIESSCMITKNSSSIIIKDAWNVSNKDLFLSSGIMPNDDPIIPKGLKNAPVLEVLARHKYFKDKMRGK